MKPVICFFAVSLLSLSSSSAPARGAETLPTIKNKTQNMQKYSGFFNFYRDESTGEIWLEIDKWQQEFLYINSLPAGIGSNDIGLDRGQLGRSRVVKFKRLGPKVLLIQPNYAYRATSANPSERRSVSEAFAQSVLWGFKVAATEGESVLVNATEFFLRDAHDVIGVLKRTGQGTYKREPTRCAIYPERTRSFPQNTEMEALLTFVGTEPGGYVRQVVPSPEAITVREHHSFVQLPDTDYRPRRFDPRAGFFSLRYQDYSTAISEPLVQRFIARHRLRKKDPTAAVSEAVEPIVYYVDSGAPEPIRSALVDGARWWNQAFEAIGYRNAFQVKILPEDVDPLDVRYNVIQWVHRATRGWSYGGSVVDPRTGEIIKGHVSLGSLRVRQDYLIATGLLGPYTDERVPPQMQEMALARLRQLAAHEVGHTLGLSHNFAASVNDRASVMDYPHPLVKRRSDGSLDLSDAYDTGIGEWDKVAIAYGYQDFPDGTDEKSALRQIMKHAIQKGLVFISDPDARPQGGAHPLAHLWDNGTDAADELTRILDIRAQVLRQFSEKQIRPGMPYATLEEVLVPMYFFHRYQTEATAKLLGGLLYTYALRGDGQKITEIVSADEQRKALKALLATLKPDVLALPESVLRLIPPRAYGYTRTRETFSIRTGVTLDPLAAAETAAEMTLALVLHPARAARLLEYHARNKTYPGLTEVLDELLALSWQAPRVQNAYFAEIQRVVDSVVLQQMMHLASEASAASQVRALVTFRLQTLQRKLEKRLRKIAGTEQRAHVAYAIQKIHRFLEEPEDVQFSRPLPPPAGSPIGLRCSGEPYF